MELSRLLLLAFALISASASATINDQTTIYRHYAFIGIEAYGERNIDEADEEEAEVYLDYRFDVQKTFNENYSAFIGLKAFLPSGNVLVNDEENTFTDDAYLEAREFWIRYHGITGYEKEHLTLGRQRLKEETGLWFNRDIESIRWQLDTTTYFYALGLSRAFNTYRTNDDVLFTDIDDRTYFYGEIGYWVSASMRVGSSIIFAKDDFDTGVGTTYTGNKRSNVNYNWLSAYISSDYFNYKNPRRFNYWASLSLLNGDKDKLAVSSDNKIITQSNTDVGAWAFNSAIRWQPTSNIKFNIGFLFNIASGGTNGNSSDEFEQTGLHSNSGRYTGFNQKIRVFSEAYRPELSNLIVAGLFASYQYQQSTISVLLNDFTRKDKGASAPKNSLRASKFTSSDALGHSVDLYWNYSLSHLDNKFLNQNQIKLIASYFKTGNYYAEDDSYYTVKLAWNWRY